MEQARLLSMTAVLTALIWASADRLVNDTATVSAVVVPVPADVSSKIIVSSGPREDLEITISGPRRVVESVQNRGGLQVRVPIQEQPTGTALVSLDDNMVRRELAERWAEFDRLRVLDLKPEAISVEVDHLISKDVELVARKLALAYEIEPQLQRNVVKLQLRESQSPSLPAGENMRVDISAEVERQLKDKPFGRSHTVTVQLDPRPFGPDAVFMPSSVEVAATVRSERGTEEVPTVPVLVAMSFGNLEKSISAVSRDGTPLSLVTQTIKVTGAPEAVDRLVRGETRAYGIIQLKEDDLRELGVVKLMTPDYQLPPGIELAAEPAPIELKLISTSTTARP